MEKRFPKEILRIIKGYEYSLIQYLEIKKKIQQIVSFNVYQPYYLRGTMYHMSDTGQIDHIMRTEMKPSWNKVISKDELIKYIIKVNREARDMFRYS